jgi:hypothetical protein
MPVTSLPQLAGRIPRRVRRLVPASLRLRLVGRFGHPVAPFDPATQPRRLNLGAGFDRRPGYVNVDRHAFHGPDLVGDVRRLPTLPSGHFEEAVAQDVLEHLERADVPVALREWRRLLAPGGRLWLRVPDLPSLLAELNATDDPDAQRGVIHRLFGTQAYDGDFHLAGFTDVTLCDELLAAGFAAIELERRDGWLWEGEARAGGLPVGMVWGTGFGQRDGDGARSAAPDSVLLLYASEPVAVELRFDLDGRAQLGDRELAPGPNALALELPRGATRLRFTASAPFRLNSLPLAAR